MTAMITSPLLLPRIQHGVTSSVLCNDKKAIRDCILDSTEIHQEFTDTLLLKLAIWNNYWLFLWGKCANFPQFCFLHIHYCDSKILNMLLVIKCHYNKCNGVTCHNFVTQIFQWIIVLHHSTRNLHFRSSLLCDNFMNR